MEIMLTDITCYCTAASSLKKNNEKQSIRAVNIVMVACSVVGFGKWVDGGHA
jgi:hypothetical protein